MEEEDPQYLREVFHRSESETFIWIKSTDEVECQNIPWELPLL